MGGVSDLNINKCNQSTLFSRMIDFWKRLLNDTYLMRPWSVENNLIFLRNVRLKCQAIRCHSFISEASDSFSCLLLRTPVWAKKGLSLGTFWRHNLRMKARCVHYGKGV